MKSGHKTFLAGTGLAMALTSVMMAAAVLGGLTSGASTLVFVLGSAGMVVFARWPPETGKAAAVGASAVGVGAVVSGLLTGFGWLEISGVVSSVVALFWVLRYRTDLGRARIWIPPIVIAAVVLLLVPLVVDGGTLGHDESAYALMAKSWLFGTPESGWGVHRGIGMSIYAYPVLAVGGSEGALRFLGLLSLVGFVGATWWLARLLGNRWTGALAALVVLASPPLLRRATEFLSDIPSAALLTVVMAIVWKEFGEAASATYRLLWLLPFAWLAFYLRYQSILSLALIIGTILLLWWRKIVARPGPLVVVAAIGFLGFIPHFLFAKARTSSVLGIMTYAGTSGGRDFSGDGLFGYSAIFGWTIAFIIGPLMIGLLGWWLIATWTDVDKRTPALFLALPASLQVLALGILGVAHARFVFFPYALIAIGGVVGLFRLSPRWNPKTGRSLFAGLAVLTIGTLALSVASSRAWVENRTLRNQPVEMTALLIHETGEGGSCGVLTSYMPQMTFYSECTTDLFRPAREPTEAVRHLVGERKFMFLLENGKRQPQGDDLEGLSSISMGPPLKIEGDRDWGWLYVFDS